MMSALASLVLQAAACTLCLRLAAGDAAHSLPTVREGNVDKRRAARGPGTVAAERSIQDTFEAMYAAKTWGTHGGGSGLGSHPPHTAYTQRIILQVRLNAEV